MADAFDQFKDAPGDDFASFKDAPPPRKDQALGFVKGLMTPLDNGAMAIETGLKKVGVPTDAINNFFHSQSVADLRQQRADYVKGQAAQGVVPGKIGEFVGNVAGTLPLAAVTKNPALLGGLSGAALTDKSDLGGVALDAGIGAVAGHYGDKLVRGVSQALKPVFSPAVDALKAAGVRLTPGQAAGGKAMVREDKLMSRPFVGDAIRADRTAGLDQFNLAATNRALEPLGLSLPKNMAPGFDATSFAQDAVEAAYNKVTPKLKLAVQPQALTAKISVPQAYQGEFDRVINEYVGSGNLTGQAVKNADRELKRLASSYTKSQVTGEQELGRALSRAHDRFTAALVAQNPVEAPALKAANKAFRGIATVQDAASRADNGVFTTGQLKQAVRRGDSSARKGASARGVAFMQDLSNAGREVLPAKYPDSGTAGRMGGGLFGGARGALDLAGYRGRQGYQAFLNAPRPAGANSAADFLLQHRGPFSLLGPAATSLLD